MQYLLRKQIILLVILLSTVFAIQAQTIDVNRPYQDEKPITLGLNIGISSGYMNFERGTAFIHPTAGQTNWISPVFNNALIMGLSGTLRLNSQNLCVITFLLA